MINMNFDSIDPATAIVMLLVFGIFKAGYWGQQWVAAQVWKKAPSDRRNGKNGYAELAELRRDSHDTKVLLGDIKELMKSQSVTLHNIEIALARKGQYGD